ncbi:MAG: type II secretion system F family protein [Acidobacteria bacterium]|nr:type II secretion system F family protein [Acidobacteriota bacterium]
MQYVCRLGTPDGRIVEQRHQGTDERSLRHDLEQRGYHVFEVNRPGVLSKLSLSSLRPGSKKISNEAFLLFNQELAALLRAGLPLLQALDLMLERMENPTFRPILEDIRDRLKAGENLSDSFASYGDTFPRLYSSSLKAGERSGDMEGVIRRFVRYLQLVTTARKKVVSALVYPAVLVGLSVGMLAVMGLFVVPKFTTFYRDMNAQLPALTRFTLAIATFFRSNWLPIVAALVIGWWLFRRWRKTDLGAVAFDRFRLGLPLLGSILHRFGLAEFSRSLATLLGGGIPLVSALEIAVDGVGNAYIRERLRPSIDLVRQGEAFHGALEKSEIFTSIAVDMVKVGEATGALDDMLTSVADFLDEQVETRSQRLLSLVEPILLVIMALIIAVLLISIYLPMFSIITQIQ